MSVVEFTEEQLEAASTRIARICGPAPNSTAAEMAELVAERHGLTVADMLGPSRLKHIVRARTDLYLVLRAAPFSWSYPAIGRFCGERDHTSIMWALGALVNKKAKRRDQAERLTGT